MARILVVEDELILALTIETILHEQGHKVVGPVARASEALHLIEAEKIDAALLDVRLRHGDVVYPAADALGERGIPFAFMTAYATEGIDPRYAEHDVLHKPFTDRDVQRALRGMLQQAQ